MRIFLIRHGESAQNTRENFDNLPDPQIPLTKKGIIQAENCAEFLKDYCHENKIDLENSVMFISPYIRTRQTAKIINEKLNIKKVREDVSLIEHQHGLFENQNEDWEVDAPQEYEFVTNYRNNNGKFYVKFPQGESPFDVALRTRIFIHTLFRDVAEGIENFFIVSHGTTIRCLLLSYFHYSPEWFNNEENMKNCSIRLIEKKGRKSYDRDYIYGGRIEKSNNSFPST